MNTINTINTKNTKGTINTKNTINTKLKSRYKIEKIYNMTTVASDLNFFGCMYFNKRRYNDALKYFFLAINFGPFRRPLTNIGICYLKLKDYGNMRKYLLMAIDMDFDYAMFQMGYYYRTIKRYDKMKKYYNMALFNRSDNYCQHYNNTEERVFTDYGNYYWLINDYENSFHWYKKAAEYLEWDGFNGMASYYEKKGDYQNYQKYSILAIQHGSFLETSRLSKFYVLDNQQYVVTEYVDKFYNYLMSKPAHDTNFKLAKYYYLTNGISDKVNNLLTVTKTLPYADVGDAFYDLGKFCGERHDYDSMEKCYLEACNYGSFEAMFSLGAYYYEFGEIDKALLYFKMSADNGDTSGILNCAICYKNKENYPVAIKYAELGLDKKDMRALQVLGEIYGELEDYDMMETYFNMALEHDCYDVYYLKGHYCHKQNKIDEMLKNHLSGVDYGIVQSMHALGKYYMSQNDHENALKYLNMAIDKGCNSAREDLIDYYYCFKKDITFVNDNLKVFNNVSIKRIVNKLLDDDFDLKFAHRYLDILNKRNLNIVNKRLDELPDKNKYNRIECCVCLDVYRKAICKCLCRHVAICHRCFVEVSSCPLCLFRYI